MKEEHLEAISVTVGPGQEHSLHEGLLFAREKAQELNRPLIPVNHLEAHCLAARMAAKVHFPFLSLLATGTSTSLTLHKDQGSNLILGLATDQAVGQALDSAAHKILGHPSVRDENERAAFLELQRGKLTDLSFLDQPGPHLASSLEQLAKWGVIE